MSGALLGLDQGYGGPAPGTNPITVQQKIVYTAMPVSGIGRRDNKNPAYGGEADSDHMRILRGEPTVMERRLATLGINAITRESQLFVFSCLNQWGDRRKTKGELVRSLTFGGFAGNDSEEDHKAGKKDRRAFPVFFGGSFTITYNGPDTIYTGDLLYWDLPNNDSESAEIAAKWGHLKTRPIGTRRTVLLRKYKPGEQGMTRRAIRGTNSSGVSKLKVHASGRTDQYYKSHVDIVDCLKKVFLLGMAASAEVLREGANKESIQAAVKRNGAMLEAGAKKLGIQYAGGVTPENNHVHEAFLAMLMPKSRGELMYEPRKAKMAPTNGASRYDPGERLLKQIQGGGEMPNGLMEANVTEHLLASMASGQYDITSRVVCRAIGSGKTGSDIDIVEFVQ